MNIGCSDKEKTHYLNINLDLRSRFGLQDIVSAMLPHVAVLNFEKADFVSLEPLADGPRTLDRDIDFFTNIIQLFNPDVREIWDSCESRCFSVGIKLGSASHQQQFVLSENSIASLSALRAELSFVVYGLP
jgi:hypothetical protein